MATVTAQPSAPLLKPGVQGTQFAPPPNKATGAVKPQLIRKPDGTICQIKTVKKPDGTIVKVAIPIKGPNGKPIAPGGTNIKTLPGSTASNTQTSKRASISKAPNNLNAAVPKATTAPRPGVNNAVNAAAQAIGYPGATNRTATPVNSSVARKPVGSTQQVGPKVSASNTAQASMSARVGSAQVHTDATILAPGVISLVAPLPPDMTANRSSTMPPATHPVNAAIGSGGVGPMHSGVPSTLASIPPITSGRAGSYPAAFSAPSSPAPASFSSMSSVMAAPSTSVSRTGTSSVPPVLQRGPQTGAQYTAGHTAPIAGSIANKPLPTTNLANQGAGGDLFGPAPGHGPTTISQPLSPSFYARPTPNSSLPPSLQIGNHADTPPWRPSSPFGSGSIARKPAPAVVPAHPPTDNVSSALSRGSAPTAVNKTSAVPSKGQSSTSSPPADLGRTKVSNTSTRNSVSITAGLSIAPLTRGSAPISNERPPTNPARNSLPAVQNKGSNVTSSSRPVSSSLSGTPASLNRNPGPANKASATLPNQVNTIPAALSSGTPPSLNRGPALANKASATPSNQVNTIPAALNSAMPTNSNRSLGPGNKASANPPPNQVNSIPAALSSGTPANLNRSLGSSNKVSATPPPNQVNSIPAALNKGSAPKNNPPASLNRSSAPAANPSASLNRGPAVTNSSTSSSNRGLAPASAPPVIPYKSQAPANNPPVSSSRGLTPGSAAPGQANKAPLPTNNVPVSSPRSFVADKAPTATAAKPLPSVPATNAPQPRDLNTGAPWPAPLTSDRSLHGDVAASWQFSTSTATSSVGPSPAPLPVHPDFQEYYSSSTPLAVRRDVQEYHNSSIPPAVHHDIPEYHDSSTPLSVQPGFQEYQSSSTPLAAYRDIQEYHNSSTPLPVHRDIQEHHSSSTPLSVHLDFQEHHSSSTPLAVHRDVQEYESSSTPLHVHRDIQEYHSSSTVNTWQTNNYNVVNYDIKPADYVVTSERAVDVTGSYPNNYVGFSDEPKFTHGYQIEYDYNVSNDVNVYRDASAEFTELTAQEIENLEIVDTAAAGIEIIDDQEISLYIEQTDVLEVTDISVYSPDSASDHVDVEETIAYAPLSPVEYQAVETIDYSYVEQSNVSELTSYPPTHVNIEIDENVYLKQAEAPQYGVTIEETVVISADMESQPSFSPVADDVQQHTWFEQERVYTSDGSMQIQTTVYEEVEEQFEGQEVVYEEVEEQFEVREVVYEGVEEQFEAREVVYEEVEEQFEVREVVYEGVEEQFEAREVVYEEVGEQFDGGEEVCEEFQGTVEIEETEVYVDQQEQEQQIYYHHESEQDEVDEIVEEEQHSDYQVDYDGTGYGEEEDCYENEYGEGEDYEENGAYEEE